MQIAISLQRINPRQNRYEKIVFCSSESRNKLHQQFLKMGLTSLHVCFALKFALVSRAYHSLISTTHPHKDTHTEIHGTKYSSHETYAEIMDQKA